MSSLQDSRITTQITISGGWNHRLYCISPSGMTGMTGKANNTQTPETAWKSVPWGVLPIRSRSRPRAAEQHSGGRSPYKIDQFQPGGAGVLPWGLDIWLCLIPEGDMDFSRWFQPPVWAWIFNAGSPEGTTFNICRPFRTPE